MDDRSEQAVRRTTEEARDFTEQTERAAKANVNVIADQAEALRHMWQAGADVASNVTVRSADQVARTFAIGGNDAQKASGNVGALAQSASVVANGARAISTEWVDFVRHSTERSFDQMGAMMRCRSPQDFVTAQTNAFRDNMEAMIDSSRRISEIALRTAKAASHLRALHGIGGHRRQAS